MAKGPGKGKKICKVCQHICAPAHKKCPECETEFAGVKNTYGPNPQIKRQAIIPLGYEGFRIRSTTYAPAGYCPIKFPTEPTPANILDWANEVRIHFLSKSGEWMLNEAIRYYLNYEKIPYGSAEYKQYSEIINSLPDIEYAEYETVEEEA